MFYVKRDGKEERIENFEFRGEMSTDCKDIIKAIFGISIVLLFTKLGSFWLKNNRTYGKYTVGLDYFSFFLIVVAILITGSTMT